MTIIPYPYRMSLGRAWIFILLSTVLISGTSWMGYLYYLHLKTLRAQDPQYNIIAIVQTSPQKEALKTVYLAELLDLSIDKPTNLYAFNIDEGQDRLKSSPLIKEATIKKIRPSTLYVDYIVRNPIAYLSDYTNTALDGERVLIPFSPFFTPKKLPKIYTGLEASEMKWGTSLQGEKADLAFHVLKLAQEMSRQEGLYLKLIDASLAQTESYGQRQLIVCFEQLVEKRDQEKVTLVNVSHLLRLGVKDYERGLKRYSQLRKKLPAAALEQHLVIDLRIPHLAFIKNRKGD